MLDFTSQTRVQFMWALGQGQTKENLTYSIHTAAMLKREPMSKRACLQNPNHISYLIMDSNSDKSVCVVVTTEDKKYCEEVLMELHLKLQVSIEYVPVLRLLSGCIQPVPLKKIMM